MNNIIELRKQGNSYNKISKLVGLSKNTVGYHCKRAGLGNRIDGIIQLSFKAVQDLREFYIDHTLKETALKFGISIATVKRYADLKRKVLTDEERKINNYTRVQNYRQRMKLKGVEYLGGKCYRCGYNKCPCALQFHHRNPEEKEFTIAKYQNLCWDRVKAELDKCDLLCANCHAEEHYLEEDLIPYSKN